MKIADMPSWKHAWLSPYLGTHKFTYYFMLFNFLSCFDFHRSRIHFCVIPNAQSFRVSSQRGYISSGFGTFYIVTLL